jgi:hypothetical protein
VRDRLDEMGDTEVVVVTFTNPRNLRGYRSRFVAPLTVVTDPSRAVYEAYGMPRASTARIWSPAVIRRYLTLMMRGARLEKPRDGEDLNQLGGDVVIDPRGRIAWAYRSRGPDDRPAVDEIVDAVRVSRAPR